MRLTKDAIERAKLPEPGHKERFIRDNVVRGLGVRITAGGAKSFVFEARIKSRPRRFTIGRWPDVTVAQAREKTHEIRAAIARGDDPHKSHLSEKHEAVFGELAERYMREYARLHKRERTWREDERLLARYVPRSWNGRKLSDVSRADIEGLHAKVGEEHGQYAANHLTRLLRHMLNRALDWGMLHGANPAQRMKLFREQKRERYLSPDELQKVNAALLQEPDWRWRAYFPIALMLGTRKSELLAMRWEDVDFTARTWRIPETKTGNTHLLPLPSPAITMLEEVPSRGKSQWVFPGDGKSGHIVEPAKAWQRVRARAGVADVRIHDLRHTLASWLVAQGFNLPLIGRALNHTQTATTARYAHLALDPVRAALEQTAALMTGDGAANAKASAVEGA